MSGSGQLFDPDELSGRVPDELSGQVEPAEIPAGSTTVRIVPDVSGLDKEFDYLIELNAGAAPPIGTMVRVDLNGRSVAGWVTEVGTALAAGVKLRPVSKIVSVGPSPSVVELARWAAHRWSGRIASVLKTASPPRQIKAHQPNPLVASQGLMSATHPARDLTPGETIVVRRGPGDDLARLLDGLPFKGSAIIVTPKVSTARYLAGQLRRQKFTTRLHPNDWEAAATRGGVVVGARSAVWASVADLGAIVVLDEHDEALQEERNPTWHARDVAIERARRAGIPCYLVSPCPSLAALKSADRVIEPGRSAERAAWPVVEIIDRRDDEPGRGGLFSDRVADLVRGDGTVLAVLNRKGRAVMLACSSCGDLARTEDGERLMVEADGQLTCPSTGETRPIVCATCRQTKLKRLRLGVTRAAEELSVLAREPVAELTAGSARSERTRIVVGTEAALHQLLSVDAVVFLDFDQELLAPRYRAAEQAMALIVLAARLVGGRSGSQVRAGGSRGHGSQIIVQTRTPDHRVLRAAVGADPERFAAAERSLREPMGLPPYGALAEVGGQGAAEFAAGLAGRDGLQIQGPRDDGRYLLRATTPEELASALAEAARPAARIRVAVDPPRA